MAGKRAVPAEPAAPATRRAAIRMTPKDFTRLRVLTAQRGLSWQTLLTEALNDWLAKNGQKHLEAIE
jgi:predicted DNA binding CopG/RHH family protein